MPKRRIELDEPRENDPDEIEDEPSLLDVLDEGKEPEEDLDPEEDADDLDSEDMSDLETY